MRTSQYFLSTVKESPVDAELISHKYMLRAGLIRKLASGIYTWLPLGLRVLQKVETIVREEMNRAGALEVLLPSIQPQELWETTDRWQTYGAELLKIRDRHDRNFCYGPTHEEVITELASSELHSYKQLPLNLYQIATKFRDEIRPRYGVMRAREFLMKDAYSFDIDSAGMQASYDNMYNTYRKIFDRIGLNYRAVLADTGSIGGANSHEFQVLADSGEDTIFYSDTSDFAANVEQAEAVTNEQRPEATATIDKVATPEQHTIKDVSEFLNVTTQQVLKTLIVHGEKDNLIALVLRGSHDLNEIKAEKLPEVRQPLTFATDAEILAELNCAPGSIGPIALKIPVIIDRSAAVMADFVCGANEDGFHFKNANWERDTALGMIADIRNVVAGDPSPDGEGTLQMCSGIEVGHIFQLEQKYSKVLNANVLDENGKAVDLLMGCYGIGVSRIVAAAIEQNHDDHGIIWPESIAPFTVAIVPIKYNKSQRVRDFCEELYTQLQKRNIEVLFDDRNERPGVMFADMDLIGIPHRIVISERGIDANVIEYKARAAAEATEMSLDQVLQLLT